MSVLRVAQFGLGPIGQACVRLLAQKPWVEIAGGVDILPELHGQPLGPHCGIDLPPEVKIYPSIEALVDEQVVDAVLHTAGSRAAVSLQQMAPMIERGLTVVSSCEELLFPRHRAPHETTEADARCRETGAKVLGTGVNPGYVLDVLPLVLTGVCHHVRGIHAERVSDAALRREPLQRKVGSGLEPAEYLRLWEEGKTGHAGFQESLLLIAHTLGWQVGEITETLEPVIAEKAITTEFFQVEPGQVRGLHQICRAETVDGRTIHLDLEMSLETHDPHDLVRIDGDPPIEARLNGGVAGDSATIAALVNALPRLHRAKPGVRLMTELAPPHWL